MSAQIKTPPHRRNPDWYKVQYRLASTLANRAFTQETPAARKDGFASAKREIDELLRACWSMLEPLPLERLFGKHRETRKFIADSVVPAGLDLKALIELGLNDFAAGEDEDFGLKTVVRRLRKGRSVSPLTIVEAIVAAKENPGPALLLDLACFFQLSKDEARAREYAAQAFEKVPAAERERLRARAADDPMLKTVPGVVVPPGKRRCQWPKREEKAEKPPRSWV